MVILTFSWARITCSRSRICLSLRREKRIRQQRDWIGSMILLLMLQARANRVELENVSIVLLSACWAPEVILNKTTQLIPGQTERQRMDTSGESRYLSASSRMMTLCLPGGSFTFFWAKALILFLTTSIPLDRSQAPRRN